MYPNDWFSTLYGLAALLFYSHYIYTQVKRHYNVFLAKCAVVIFICIQPFLGIAIVIACKTLRLIVN